jgi:cystathionine beta-lyase
VKDATKLIHLARGSADTDGIVNMPLHRASTVLYPDVEAYVHRFDGDRRYTDTTYGATGTANAKALGQAVAALEGGYRAMITATGLSAVTMAMSGVLKAGDHTLVTDSVYGPSRNFCSNTLAGWGIETTFYEPGIGAGIAALFQDNTRLVYTEAPGSLTFEMQDVPAITAAAKARGILVAMDNTWATPLFFKPLEHGVDISIQAGTKYFAGHSDLVIGMITTADEALYKHIADHLMGFGDVASPDDCFMTLRGMRTMDVRLERQQASALLIARWLEQRDEVKRVLYPPLESDPGHTLWKRDFTGAASLFGVELHSKDYAAVTRMVNGMEYFGIGSSWGGYESLVALNRMPIPRDVATWPDTPFLLRYHIGLEDPDDLLADLEASLGRLR